jgi:selenocysteine lyase/cysteine desulfurase
VRFESWESNVAAKLGLGRAVEYALRIGIDRIEQRVTRLASSADVAREAADVFAHSATVFAW